MKPAAAKRCGKCRQCIFMERRCQSSYNLLNLPVGSQSFGFAKTSFFGWSSTLAKLVLLLIVHDLATPHDAFDDNGAGNEDSESGSALLKARTAGMLWLLH
jgi:hypothetical protein